MIGLGAMFCPKCGALMVRKGDKWVCPSCGYEMPIEGNPRKRGRVVAAKKPKETIIMGSSYENLPKIKGVVCPVCGNDEAYYRIVQTRAADEPETRIYICTKCGHVWREYA